MAKAARKARSRDPAKLTVRYDLFELPTAFHKAGLAGLVLLIDSLKSRKKLSTKMPPYELTATSATFSFTKALIQKLFDDLYDARTKQRAVKSKWKSAKVARPATAAEKEAGTPYVYNVDEPRGKFLCDNYPDEDGLWLGLWRDLMWNVLRGRHKAREPYRDRAQKKRCREAAKAWSGLVKRYQQRGANERSTSELSSSLYPGAQAINAEAVPFADSAAHALLLHFWPLTTLIFVPQFVDADGQSYLGKRTKTDKQRHLAVTVPEVRDLVEFVQAYPNMLNHLTVEPRGYLPAQAVVDLPAESALAYSDRLAILTAKPLEAGQLRYSISSVEYQHLVKDGNNVKAIAGGRVVANRRLIADYHALVNPIGESTRYRNPLFRRGLLIALLHGDQNWFRPFGKAFKDFDCELFLRQSRAPDSEERRPPSFHVDAAKKLRDETQLHTEILERMKTMSDTERPATPLPVLVDRIVRTYLLALTEGKPGLSLQKYRDAEGRVKWDEIPRETLSSFNAAKRDIAESLFYEFRSRRDQAFVELFRSRMFAPKQFLSEPDRFELASVMRNFERLDDLKTLTLLALSANS